MATPSDRTEFINYCLRKLGSPVININVSAEQVDDRVDEALSYFYEMNYQGSEEVFILYDIKDDDKALGYIQLPNDMLGVTDVFKPSLVTGINATEFQFYMQEIYNAINPNNMLGGGLSYFYMHASHLKLLQRFFNPDRQYDYNPITNKLIIAGGLKSLDTAWGGVIIRGWRKLHGEVDDQNPTNTVIHNIWKNRWLQNYTTALIKEQWGNNLGKYQQVQLLGGVMMNGEQIKIDAKQEIAELREELELTYQLPPTFVVG